MEIKEPCSAPHLILISGFIRSATGLLIEASDLPTESRGSESIPAEQMCTESLKFNSSAPEICIHFHVYLACQNEHFEPFLMRLKMQSDALFSSPDLQKKGSVIVIIFTRYWAIWIIASLYTDRKKQTFTVWLWTTLFGLKDQFGWQLMHCKSSGQKTFSI